MRSSIPLSLTNKTLSAASGKTYHLVDKSGEPLKVFFTKIVDEQLVIRRNQGLSDIITLVGNMKRRKVPVNRLRLMPIGQNKHP
ncbi:hypothetical protein ACI3PW_07755 [Glaesserella parasuis]|uniref:hypothetical protein n=1 Tax=Glaesserella parasuis TaxID=738 RepID=UPI0038551039